MIACSACVVLVVTALAVTPVVLQHLAADVKSLHQAATSDAPTLVHQLAAGDYSADSREECATADAHQLLAAVAKSLPVTRVQLLAVVAKSLLLLVTVAAVQLLAVVAKSLAAIHVVADVMLAASRVVVHLWNCLAKPKAALENSAGVVLAVIPDVLTPVQLLAVVAKSLPAIRAQLQAVVAKSLPAIPVQLLAADVAVVVCWANCSSARTVAVIRWY